MWLWQLFMGSLSWVPSSEIYWKREMHVPSLCIFRNSSLSLQFPFSVPLPLFFSCPLVFLSGSRCCLRLRWAQEVYLRGGQSIKSSKHSPASFPSALFSLGKRAFTKSFCCLSSLISFFTIKPASIGCIHADAPKEQGEAGSSGSICLVAITRYCIMLTGGRYAQVDRHKITLIIK